MQATQAFRLKIGDARYVPRTARLFAESFTPSILFEVQRRGAASVLRKPHINVATPSHQFIPTPLWDLEGGAKCCLTPTFSTLLQAAGRAAAAAAPARLLPPLHLHQDAVAQGEVPRLQVVVHQAGLLPASRGKSAFK